MPRDVQDSISYYYVALLLEFFKKMNEITLIEQNKINCKDTDENKKNLLLLLHSLYNIDKKSDPYSKNLDAVVSMK
jgi:hypothetical protein